MPNVAPCEVHVGDLSRAPSVRELQHHLAQRLCQPADPAHRPAALRSTPALQAWGAERPVHHATAPWWPDNPGRRRGSQHSGAVLARSSIPTAPFAGRSPAPRHPGLAGSQVPPAPQTIGIAQTMASMMAQASMVACRPPFETIVLLLAPTCPRQSPRLRSTGHQQSKSKNAAGAPAARPEVGPEKAACYATHDLTGDDLPSQHSSPGCCDDRLNPPSIRRWRSAAAAGKRACARPWARSVTLTTTPCAKASSPRWSAT